MKTPSLKLLFLLSILPLLLHSCKEPIEVAPTLYECQSIREIDNSLFEKSDSVEQLLADKAEHIVGTQIYLKTKDGVEWNGAHGQADIPNEVDLESCTPTMIGSISKIFTGVLIMQLEEEGALDINDPIRLYLGKEIVDNVANAEEATIRQLLKHRSGIRDYLNNEIWIDALNRDFYTLTPTEKLEEYVYDKSAEFPVDERYSYSNSNYILLELIAESIKNKSFPQLVTDYIINPLGLEHTIQTTPDNPIPAGTARPYYSTRDGKYVDIIHHAVSDGATGDGGVSSNMLEIATFIQALFDGKLVSEETLNKMTTDTTLRYIDTEGNVTAWYGLGLEIKKSPSGISYGHGGSTGSYNTYLSYYPDTEAISAIHFTSDHPDEPIWEDNNDVILKKVNTWIRE